MPIERRFWSMSAAMARSYGLRRQAGRLRGFSRCGCFGDATIEIGLGTRNTRAQLVVRLEETGRLIEVTHDAFHGLHAVADQREIFGGETDTAVVGLAHPVIERACEPDTVTCDGGL